MVCCFRHKANKAIDAIVAYRASTAGVELAPLLLLRALVVRRVLLDVLELEQLDVLAVQVLRRRKFSFLHLKATTAMDAAPGTEYNLPRNRLCRVSLPRCPIARIS